MEAGDGGSGPAVPVSAEDDEVPAAEVSGAGGAEITLEVLSFEPFVVNGYEVSMERLRNPYLRKLVESIAILTEARLGSMVLNWGRELVMRQRLRLLPQVERMEPEERRRFLKFMAAEFKKAEL